MAETGTTRMTNFMKKILNGDQESRAMSFSKRITTLKKKAHELQTLCDVKVCMVCFGPDGTIHTWPEGVAEVKDAIMSYKGLDARKKHESCLLGYLQGKKKKLELKIQKVKHKKVEGYVANWSRQIDGLSEEDLRDTVAILDSKLFDLKERIKLLSMQNNKGKATQDHADMELEIIKSSVPVGAAGATLALPAGVMDTKNNIVENIANINKDAAVIECQMPPLLNDFGNNWLEIYEAYQHDFENDDWFNEFGTNNSLCKD